MIIIKNTPFSFNIELKKIIHQPNDIKVKIALSLYVTQNKQEQHIDNFVIFCAYNELAKQGQFFAQAIYKKLTPILINPTSPEVAPFLTSPTKEIFLAYLEAEINIAIQQQTHQPKIDDLRARLKLALQKNPPNYSPNTQIISLQTVLARANRMQMPEYVLQQEELLTNQSLQIHDLNIQVSQLTLQLKKQAPLLIKFEWTKAQLKSLKEKLDRLQNPKNSEQKFIHHLPLQLTQKEIEELKQKSSVAEDALKQSQQQATQQASLIDEQKDKIQHLEDDLADSNKKVTDMAEQLKALQQQLTDTKQLLKQQNHTATPRPTNLPAGYSIHTPPTPTTTPLPHSDDTTIDFGDTDPAATSFKWNCSIL